MVNKLYGIFLALHGNLIYNISHMITFVVMYGINDYMTM
jgi:hypothetical protein